MGTSYLNGAIARARPGFYTAYLRDLKGSWDLATRVVRQVAIPTDEKYF